MLDKDGRHFAFGTKQVIADHPDWWCYECEHQFKYHTTMECSVSGCRCKMPPDLNQSRIVQQGRVSTIEEKREQVRRGNPHMVRYGGKPRIITL